MILIDNWMKLNRIEVKRLIEMSKVTFTRDILNNHFLNISLTPRLTQSTWEKPLTLEFFDNED